MGDSKKDVVVTYETLFEFLRCEKSKSELQRLEDSFFDDVLAYMEEKAIVLRKNDDSEGLFISAEKEKARRELDNIRRILKELYDRREKKLLDMAMIKSRTDASIIDTSSFLEPEKALFDTITNDLKLYRSSNLSKVMGGNIFSTEPLRSPKESLRIQKSTPQTKENPNLYKEESSQPERKSVDGPPKVRFLKPVEEIVGPDLQVYGPFKLGMTAELPKELARALINNKQAELL